MLTNSTFTGFRGSIEISGLRMAFSIRKTLANSTNTCQFRVYNLSADKRSELREFGDELRLYAGYVDNGGDQLLFIGNVNDLRHDFAQPEIITNLGCGDGERALNNTLISTSFAPGVSVRTVIEYCAQRLGMEIIFFDQTANLTYANGFSENGYAKNILGMACTRLNLNWSVQNGKLLILRNNAATDKPESLINVNTGMIGVPQRFVDKKQYLYRSISPNEPPKPGWKVKTLLRPDLLPGDKIRVQSAIVELNSTLVINEIQHVGDTYGPNFESIIEAFPL